MNNSTDAATPTQAILIFTIVGNVVVSILGMIGSVTTVTVIVASKSLHSPCFMLIAGGGIGSFTVAAHYFTRCIDKIGLELGIFGFERTGLRCLLLTGVLGIWGIAFHSQMSCLIAIDRLISVAAPMKYRHLGKRYAVGILTTCALLMTIQEAIGFSTAPLHINLLCTEFVDALHPLFINTYAEINLFYCAVNVLAYGAMMISFRFRHLFFDGTAQDSFMKQQVAVMPTVKLMVCLYLLTGVLAEILVNIGLQLLPSQPAFMLLATGNILKDASSLVEGLSLLIRNQRFRDCFRVLIARKTRVVTVSPVRASGRNH